MSSPGTDGVVILPGIIADQQEPSSQVVTEDGDMLLLEEGEKDFIKQED